MALKTLLICLLIGCLALPADAAQNVRVLSFEGHLSAERKGRELRVSPFGDNILQDGDTLFGEEDADLAMLIHDFAGFQIVGESEFRLVRSSLSQVHLFFVNGAPIFNVRQIPNSMELLLETNRVLVRAGSGQFYISTTPKHTTVCTHAGEVFLTAKDSGSSLKILAGFCVDVSDEDSIAQLRAPTVEDEASFEDARSISTSG